MNQRTTMNRKPVYEIPAKTVINFDSGFAPKLLCDGPTFSLGTACVYSCSFCYVPPQMVKSPHLAAARAMGATEAHEGMVIRRKDALHILERQLLSAKGKPLFMGNDQNGRVIYSSPLVDVAGNLELARETAEACRIILRLTRWDIRLLSKSNLLPQIAEKLGHENDAHSRVIYGVSTGTLDDKMARVFESGTPLPSKRLASLHELQEMGKRTFGMICPSLPQRDYDEFATAAALAIRYRKCEEIWAEVINVRGESMTLTVSALRAGGFTWEADELERVSTDREAWERYSRETFLAHRMYISDDKLRFLQYVTKANHDWWREYAGRGAVLLGKIGHAEPA